MIARIRMALLALAFIAAPTFAADPQCAWRPSWGSAQMTPDTNHPLAEGGYADKTVRQIVHLSTGGDAIRVRLSNAFGTTPLAIGSASIAPTNDNKAPSVDPASLRPLLFGGRRDVVIPAGAEMLSDPVDLSAPAFADLAISIHYSGEPSGQTGHPGARSTGWVVSGDQADAASFSEARTMEQWFQLSQVDVMTCANPPVIVALGDSITDGRGTTTNGNDRWTDILARRLAGKAAVLNMGIGGNRLLLDGLGPNALARLERDVLARPGVTHLIVLEGINDLGTSTRDAPISAADHATLVARMIEAYRQIIERAHAHGIKVVGGTIMPFMGFDYYHPDDANEADRQALNAWIRTPGHFDAVVDFDLVMRDPAHPDRLNPAFDVGDHIHPNPDGYRAMGQAIPLELLSHSWLPR